MINSNKVLKSVDTTHESVAHISKSASKSAINELNNSGEKERCNLIDAIKSPQAKTLVNSYSATVTKK